jgi:hypothetical protein
MKTGGANLERVALEIQDSVTGPCGIHHTATDYRHASPPSYSLGAETVWGTRQSRCRRPSMVTCFCNPTAVLGTNLVLLSLSHKGRNALKTSAMSAAVTVAESEE